MRVSTEPQIREPASMALFADEGVGKGIASRFGVRETVWRPGAILSYDHGPRGVLEW